MKGTCSVGKIYLFQTTRQDFFDPHRGRACTAYPEINTAYSHANTPLGQSKRAYHFNYFITSNVKPLFIASQWVSYFEQRLT